ncbi:ABC transporter ATP-binding protein [Aeoliella sp. ICT_H6.2]|uniref:ABC transporter ATP-binding protein n=1 Tax=Aeoliella straminimaris TaxID=2954799 RepID=A0A9X2F915_9BACT|nr:ABC transporter ATP-binding protein [Aeoliella straminimaris]MCO6043883.1 ABC transporter ATP-binding protein [Aeoliella straminimaris]
MFTSRPATGSLAASIHNLHKQYVLGGETVHALRDVSFDVPRGDYISIMGPSGSGKSTLLNLLGCLDTPTSGNFFLGDLDVAAIDDDHRAEVRSTLIGFVFQSFYLLPALTVVENIEVPLLYSGRLDREARQRAIHLAEQVGLGSRLGHRPTQLSGGQQQRVAIARSLVNDPRFLLADEPTGNLDSQTTTEILELLDNLNKEGRTILLVTHEPEVAEHTKRKIVLRDGRVQIDERMRPC